MPSSCWGSAFQAFQNWRQRSAVNGAWAAGVVVVVAMVMVAAAMVMAAAAMVVVMAAVVVTRARTC
jgi:hypothetical protein